MSVHAVVLIECEIDEIPEAAQAIADLEGVSEVYSVAGEFDLVAIVRVANHVDLATVIPGGIGKEWFVFVEPGNEWTSDEAVAGFTVRRVDSVGGGLQAISFDADGWRSMGSDPRSGGLALAQGVQ